MEINKYIDKKAKETMKKTKGTKLNYFDPMGTKSHILPDAAAGIPRFNSNMGVSSDGTSTAGAATTGSTGGGMGEALVTEGMDRATLINEIKSLGFEYRFDKYTDAQLFRIYQWALEKNAEMEAAKELANKPHEYKDSNEVEFNGDTFEKDGIEFESDEAAHEYFDESVSPAIDTEALEIEVTRAVLDTMEKMGFDDTDAAYYSDVDLYNSDNRIVVEVRAEISYEGMEELAAALDPIVQKYDDNAYFDFDEPGIMSAYIQDHAASIREAFKKIDSELFDKYGESFELEMFYESIKKDLTAEEQNKIKKFVSIPGITAEEARTFIAGMEKTKPGQTAV